jgi:hypothetical protein
MFKFTQPIQNCQRKAGYAISWCPNMVIRGGGSRPRVVSSRADCIRPVVCTEWSLARRAGLLIAGELARRAVIFAEKHGEQVRRLNFDFAPAI